MVIVRDGQSGEIAEQSLRREATQRAGLIERSLESRRADF